MEWTGEPRKAAALEREKKGGRTPSVSVSAGTNVETINKTNRHKVCSVNDGDVRSLLLLLLLLAVYWR